MLWDFLHKEGRVYSRECGRHSLRLSLLWIPARGDTFSSGHSGQLAGKMCGRSPKNGKRNCLRREHALWPECLCVWGVSLGSEAGDCSSHQCRFLLPETCATMALAGRGPWRAWVGYKNDMGHRGQRTGPSPHVDAHGADFSTHTQPGHSKLFQFLSDGGCDRNSVS